MFDKVLIANRGEIALRILRACQERGLRTVAVYSEADRAALHVRYADEAYCIGPAPARQSYLNGAAIIAAARASGAQAIHPGYGFLAENADFAQSVLDAGLAWIGPSPAAIRALGDKVAARRLMQAAGVPIVPGSESDLSDAELARVAAELGFPVMVKAAAGGGGKGMRLVAEPANLPAALAAARREALSAFGNESVYIEKVIQRPRHVEIQILADQHGNCVHLGERECSIQRRHQKLIEEAPCQAVTPEMRAQMGEIAIRAALAAGYSNAGTVEFLLDRDGRFYFLEMNTRLQVEHAVTEMVTGVDIIKEQLAIADGRRLRLTQDEIQIKGHAIECRINAEDPYNNFLPAAGRITSLIEPTGPGVRLESGIYAGFEVSLYYDPLIAKLIVWGETRAQAILRMRRALRELRIGGIHTNVPFHQQVMDNTRYQAGKIDTGFLEGPEAFRLSAGANPALAQVAAIAATLVEHARGQQAVVLGAAGEPAPSATSVWKRAGRIEAQRRR